MSTELVSQPRLPYPPAVQERFGIDKSSWKALVEAIFPNAASTDSAVLALAYCKARNLDPFKKCVHIVPIWDKKSGRMVDTVWPGIAELRTTAFRTGLYVGREPTEFGPTVLADTIGSVVISYPQWAQVTVYRQLPNGERAAFPGPRVYWEEAFGRKKNGDPTEMWTKRPFGQVEKCAEAAALRGAFPEELGNDIAVDEIDGREWHGRPAVGRDPAVPAIDHVAEAREQRRKELVEANDDRIRRAERMAEQTANDRAAAPETPQLDECGPSSLAFDPPTPEEATGVAAPREPLVDVDQSTIASIQMCIQIGEVNDIEKGLDPEAESTPRLKEHCQHQRLIIRSQRGERSKGK